MPFSSSRTDFEPTSRQEMLLRRDPARASIYDAPIYATIGIELDYTKVLKSTRWPQKRAGGSRAADTKMMDKELAKNRNIEQIMGFPKNGLGDALVRIAVRNRRSSD